MKIFLNQAKYILPTIFMCVVFYANSCISAVIKVNAKSVVTPDKIYLKDIISSDASDDILKKINNIKIGSSPLPGKKKNIPVSLIKSRVYSVIPKAEIDIQIPAEIIVVERASQLISDLSLKKLYTSYVEKKLNGKKFKISKINIKGNKKLPTGKLSIEVEENTEKNVSGHYRLIVNVTPENGKKRRLLITGWIDRYEIVVYAKKEIAKGETIHSKDLYTELTNITKYPSDVFNSTELMRGQVAKTRIRKNVLVRQKMLAVSPVIKKGDMVKMAAKSGSLTVVTTGRAIGDAQVGEQVRVRNLKSKKIVTGFVLDAKMVEVVF